jgi:hypothetical protein
MPHLSADVKHHILLEYAASQRGRGFAALAQRHGIAGGGGVMQRWHVRWDGTPASLEEGVRSGRPRVLTEQQVTRHVAPPIRNANRAGRRVRLTRVAVQVRAATGFDVSTRSVQRYAHDELGAKQTRGKKRTAEECMHAYAICVCDTCVVGVCTRHH